ncbi:zinc finger protein-domain-containing protein [Paraphoma chrysanthemicola]|uniref:Zinc finger protein-domain-containing protein n=1 Tax=Paraphoma chrysanthemicola TaxID=798071 RepID=A0A8K0R697_9PLEO|nr:zinc finger protein-domain-containing protein [Paraphoma chrysanthemicola]
MDAFQTNNQFRCIGSGCCGSVWTPDDAPDWVIKCEDGNNGRSIANDQLMHRRVLASIPPQFPVQIPQSYDLIDANDPWWTTHLAKFPPEKHRKACRGYFQERIPAVPLPAREMLIEPYCRASLQGTAKASRENEDCLIRIYAGARRRTTRPPMFFNLRNYGLHIDQMVELGLDTVAKVDANDVEFVLAPATKAGDAVPRFEIAGQEMVVWMLDFDCVREMGQDVMGVEQAVTAVYRNDAYFPRPHFYGHTQDDVELWEMFKMHFRAESSRLLGGESAGLAEEWVRLVEEEGRRRAGRDCSVCNVKVT